MDGLSLVPAKGGQNRPGSAISAHMTKPMQNLPFKVAALYRFARFPGFREFREPLIEKCRALGIKGTLLLAHEGINGTVAATPDSIDALVDFIKSVPEFDGMELKFSQALTMPFNRMKVRLKKEIVTMGVPDTDPLKVVGTYVSPKDWNALIADPDTIVIDTRNDYEYRMGTFEGAVDPDIRSFVEFPDWVREHRGDMDGKKVAMFCTGGIRCEKSTAFAKENRHRKCLSSEGWHSRLSGTGAAGREPVERRVLRVRRTRVSGARAGAGGCRPVPRLPCAIDA